jgi:hypothetical protein
VSISTYSIPSSFGSSSLPTATDTSIPSSSDAPPSSFYTSLETTFPVISSRSSSTATRTTITLSSKLWSSIRGPVGTSSSLPVISVPDTSPPYHSLPGSTGTISTTLSYTVPQSTHSIISVSLNSTDSTGYSSFSVPLSSPTKSSVGAYPGISSSANSTLVSTTFVTIDTTVTTRIGPISSGFTGSASSLPLFSCFGSTCGVKTSVVSPSCRGIDCYPTFNLSTGIPRSTLTSSPRVSVSMNYSSIIHSYRAGNGTVPAMHSRSNTGFVPMPGSSLFWPTCSGSGCYISRPIGTQSSGIPTYPLSNGSRPITFPGSSGFPSIGTGLPPLTCSGPYCFNSSQTLKPPYGTSIPPTRVSPSSIRMNSTSATIGSSRGPVPPYPSSIGLGSSSLGGSTLLPSGSYFGSSPLPSSTVVVGPIRGSSSSTHFVSSSFSKIISYSNSTSTSNMLTPTISLPLGPNPTNSSLVTGTTSSFKAPSNTSAILTSGSISSYRFSSLSSTDMGYGSISSGSISTPTSGITGPGSVSSSYRLSGYPPSPGSSDATESTSPITLPTYGSPPTSSEADTSTSSLMVYEPLPIPSTLLTSTTKLREYGKKQMP